MHYAAAKAAVVSLSENLALYCEPRGIRVSCLCPGPVMTTSTHDMRHFSKAYAMRGPGSALLVKSQEKVATILADGMRDGRILIPTHDEACETLRDRGADPDGFVRGMIARFEGGDAGLPRGVSADLEHRRDHAS